MAINTDDFSDNIPVLDYSIMRPKIKSGDILLCSGTSLFSEIIKKSTHSVWSHVAFIIRLDAIDRLMVLESVESIGVRTVPLSAYVYNYNGSGKGYPGKILIARHALFNPANVSKLSRFAVDLLGYPYDNQDVLRIAARIGMEALGFSPKDNIIAPGKTFLCSEYAYACYQSVGIKINYDPEGFIVPADFARTPDISPVGFIPAAQTGITQRPPVMGFSTPVV